MAGTKEGSEKAVETIYAKFGRDYFAKVGAMGGRAGHSGGFAANRNLASAAGRLGGQISRRGKHKLSAEERHRIRLKYETEYAKAYKELLAIHKDASKKPRIDDGTITVYTRKRGLIKTT